MKPEAVQIAMSSSSLVPEYSLEDIERFLRETNLCPTCWIIFSSQGAWRPADHIEHHCYFEHYPSAQNLWQLVEAGCSLCFKLRADVVRRVTGSSCQELEDEGDAALQSRGPLLFRLDHSPQCLWFWTRLKTESSEDNILVSVLDPIDCKSTLSHIPQVSTLLKTCLAHQHSFRSFGLDSPSPSPRAWLSPDRTTLGRGVPAASSGVLDP